MLKIREDGDNVVVEIIMTREDYDAFVAAGNADADDKGLRKDYCIECHAKGANGSTVRWTEKAINSVAAHLQGAPKCMAETGNPSNQATKGDC